MATIQRSDAKAIVAEAFAAAKAAGEAENAKLPPEEVRGLDCGFGWVDIKPARGAVIAELKDREDGGYRKTWGGGGWQVMMHAVPTQSISVHYASAQAFAAVLKKHGIDAVPGRRYD